MNNTQPIWDIYRGGPTTAQNSLPNGGPQANLSDLDFSGADLSNADFTSINLSAADLSTNQQRHVLRHTISQFLQVQQQDVQNSEDTIHTYWFKKAGEPTHGLEERWKILKQENNFAHFATLLARLSKPQEIYLKFQFLQAEPVPASDVVAVIKSILNSPSICKLVLEEARGAADDCGERPLSLFNTIQGIAAFGKRQSAGAASLELFELAKGIARQSLLDGATDILMTKRWKEGRLNGNDPTELTRGTGPNKKEELEFQMALRHALEKELDLPFPVNPLCADEYAKLTREEINSAKDFVNDIMGNEDSLLETMINLPVWVQYMEPLCEKAKADINIKFDKRYDDIEEANEKGSLNNLEYLEKMNKLPTDRQSEIDAILRVKTQELCDFWREDVS